MKTKVWVKLKICVYPTLYISQVQDGKPSELKIARFGWIIYHPIETGWKILSFKSHILNGREFHPNAISFVLDGLKFCYIS